MALPNEPITRQEMYLSNIAGQNTALPDAPITREEMYLDYIAKTGGTGEGDMKKSIYDSDNSVASAGGIKMFVNQKIGTLPQRVGSLETTAGVLEGEVASIEDDLDNLGTAAFKNSTSVVTESSDLVESGAVLDTLRDAEVVEGKNLLIYPYDTQTTTYAWGTVIVNSDGSITVNGTTTERTAIKLETPAINYNLPNGNYILSLENVQSGAALLLEGYNGLTWYKVVGSANVDNPSVSISIDHNGYTNLSVYISIESGTTLNNVTFKPMISVNGGAYEPYYIPLKDVVPQKCDNSVIGTVEDGSTASQAYAVGEHFIRNGKFCTVTQAISSGGTLTENTNYVEGTIADNLIKQATFSETTDASGNISVSSDLTRVIVGIKFDDALRIGLPLATANYLLIKCFDSNMNTLANTKVTGTYYYI